MYVTGAFTRDVASELGVIIIIAELLLIFRGFEHG